MNPGYINAHEFARNALANHDAAHDYQHAVMVLQNAITIIQGLTSNNVRNIDSELVMYTALFHDIIDHKIYPGKDQEVLFDSIIQPFLVKENLVRLSDRMKYIICNMSWSKKKTPDSLEMAIVMDADRLEAIGCIGIARTFAYNAGKPLSKVVDHYYEKLQYVKDKMYTSVGKDMAAERDTQMNTFFKEFEKQTQVTIPYALS